MQKMLVFNCSSCFEFWKAFSEHYCWAAFQISKESDNFDMQTYVFKVKELVVIIGESRPW